MTRGILLVAALATCASVACSDPRAGTLPSASPSASATSGTPTPTASADLAASLRNALQTYFDALYAAGMDPANRTDALAALIDPACACYRVVDVLREEARTGRYIDYTYALRDVAVIDAGPTQGDIRYTVIRSAGAERDRSGKVVEAYPATTEKYTARFTRPDDHWLLNRLTLFK